MNRIDVSIIGAQKAGTTSLLRWLGQHPGIRAQRVMEFNYFTDRERFEQNTFDRFFQKHFAPQNEAAQMTLIKHVGLFEDAPALNLLREHNPALRLIVVLREPAERAWSAFWFAVSRGYEADTDFVRAAFQRPRDYFADPFRRRSTDYVARGFYYDHLQQLEQIFPREQVWVLQFENLKKDPQGVCDTVFRFLGISSYPIAIKTENKTCLPRFRWLSRVTFWVKPVSRILPVSWHKFLKIRIKKVNPPEHPASEMPTTRSVAGGIP